MEKEGHQQQEVREEAAPSSLEVPHLAPTRLSSSPPPTSTARAHLPHLKHLKKCQTCPQHVSSSLFQPAMFWASITGALLNTGFRDCPAAAQEPVQESRKGWEPPAPHSCLCSVAGVLEDTLLWLQCVLSHGASLFVSVSSSLLLIHWLAAAWEAVAHTSP